MPVWLESLEINEENVSGNIDYLKGNMFQKIEVNIEIRVETWVEMNTTDEVYFGDPGMTTTDWITATWPFATDFNVGDSLAVVGSRHGNNDSALYVITEKPSDYEIRITGFGMTSTLENSGKIHLVQESKGIILDYGLIENAEATNFNSKVDGSLMRYEYGADPIGATPILMNPLGKKDWQLGITGLDDVLVSNTSAGDDISNYRYKFMLSQTFIIHPMFLAPQITDLLNSPRLAPKYFRLINALKYVFRIRALRTLQDPNVYQEGVFDQKIGNTGWEGEEYNGGDAEYEIDNLVYSNSLGIVKDSVVNVSFDVVNTADNTNGDAEFVCVNFIMLPEDASQYQNKDEFMSSNFCFDRANQQEGAAAINGIQNGTGFQAITNLTVTSGASLVTVQFDMDFGTSTQAVIDALNDKRFMIAAYAVGNALSAELANYTLMFVDIDEIKIDIPDTIITCTPELFFHDQNDFTSPVTSPEFTPEDEIVGYSAILLDRSSLDAQIDTMRGEVYLEKTGEDDVILDQIEFDLTGAPIIGDVRFINETPDTPFAVLSTEIRSKYKAVRDTSTDSGSSYGYYLQHPFLIRWEYWEQLFLTTLPGDFLDITEQFNGYNQNWYRLSQLSGWSLKYRLSTDVTVQNTTKTINKAVDITLNDYLSNTDWINETIECYDGATLLDVGGTPYIKSKSTGIDTTIRAEFEHLSAAPAVGDLWGLIRVIPKEVGTYIANDSASSEYNRSSLSFLSGTGGKVTISNPSGNVIRLECTVQASELPDGVTDFTISARLGQASSTI